MKAEDRIELFQKDIDDLDHSAQLADIAYETTQKMIQALNNAIKDKKKNYYRFSNNGKKC